MNQIIFHSGSVPVAVAARVYGKEASWVRAGIISGWLPIGTATRKGNYRFRGGKCNWTLSFRLVRIHKYALDEDGNGVQSREQNTT